MTLTKREGDRLIAAHFGFARKRARIFAAKNPSLDFAELESAAMWALAGSVKNFDPAISCFATYAGVRIDGYLRSCRRKEINRIRRMDDRASAHLGVDSGDDDEDNYLARRTDDAAPVQEDHAEAVLNGLDGSQTMADWLDTITDPREQETLLRRLRGERVEDIAEHFEVVPSTVYRWLNSARKSVPETTS